jgi:hypothetical protein
MAMGPPKDMQLAGTGFMMNPTDALRELERRGYVENLVPRFDHLELHDGRERLGLDEFDVDLIVRFENTSDPDDQAILYAVSFGNRKGTFLESYGLYHEELSERLLRKLTGRGDGHTRDGELKAG